MSRTTHTSALRPLAGAGLLAAAALAAPPAAHAQTRSEAALMNHRAPTVFIANPYAWGSAATFRTLPGLVGGERALLTQTPIVRLNPETGHADVAAAWVDGAYALLGRRRPLDASARR